MKTLISLSEYVLQEEKTLENILNENFPTLKIAASYERIIKYTKFLRQPLRPGMFYPTDENGIILKDISDDEDDDFGLCSAVRRQKIGKARGNILFEGFETESGIAVAKSICMTFVVIEDLVTKKHSLKELTLTPSALKIIGEKE